MNRRYHIFLLIFVLIFHAWTLYGTKDYLTWGLEVFPTLIGAIIIFATYRRFPLSNLSYTLIAIHSIILAYGGRTTYAEAPLGYWLSEIFGWSRNNYDKIGHLAQGFIPAIWLREIMIRLSVVSAGGGPSSGGKNTRWLNFIIVFVVLGFSAFYEFIEWWIALLAGSAGDAFLGTQGYVWDTQSDMFLAMLGAIAGLILLTKWHDRSMGKISTQ